MKRILVVLSFFLGFAVASATADMRGHDNAETMLATGLNLALDPALDQASGAASTAHCAQGEGLACHAISAGDGLIAAPSNRRPARLVAGAGALAGKAVFRREPKPPRL